MFKQTLLPDTVRAIQLAAQVPIISQSYLAGGTALALQLGHRISVDLDFFTGREFEEEYLAAKMAELPDFLEEGKAWRTVWGKIGETKFSLFYYKYPLLRPTTLFEGIELASKEDIAAMKIHALEERGARRDFVDIYFLSKEFTLEQILGFYDQKYGTLQEHLYSIIRSLDYFVDADNEVVDPKMLIPMSWEKVKEFFKTESMRLAKTL